MIFLYIFTAVALSTCGTGRTQAAIASVDSFPVQDALEEEPQAVIEWDKTVHDFGDVSVSDGPLSCSFTLTNVSSESITIFEVVSSCGCTGVDFPKNKIEPGQSAVISATYKNEDGPTAFDKTLTVYISGIKRPVILRLRGVVHPKKKSLSELYSPEKLGDLGLKSRNILTGGLKQGLSVSETATVANLGRKPLNVTFTDVSKQLTVSVSPNPIPAGQTARIAFTVKADSELYGLNSYTATPVLNGAVAEAPLTVATWTQENFALWSSEDIRKASNPAFETSTFSFNTVKAGEKIRVSFPCVNKGSSVFHIFKADADSPALTPVELPDIKSKGTVVFTLDTALLPEGDNVIMITLTTNSPQRPVVNLFVTGCVEVK